VPADAENLPAPTPVRYRAVSVKDKSDVERLKSELGSSGMALVRKVNRRDTRHIRPGVVVQVPDGDWPIEAFSPFPAELKQLSKLPKAILVSLTIQAFAAYENGRQVRWGPVNSGTQKQATPSNLYYTNWRSPRKVSTINRRWVMQWYVNLHTSMGVAFHQYAMPGYPASYGCLRLLAEDAKWIYGWADFGVPSSDGAVPDVFGTPVIVSGEYDYSQPPPWGRLHHDPTAASVDPAELRAALEKYLWVILERAGLG